MHVRPAGNFTRVLLTAGILFTSTCARATFSIVAVDTVTGEVGGAGASCISFSNIINDLIQGVGAIHTQSLYLSGNQNYAHELMELGLSPQQILDSLFVHDQTGDPEDRQYGIADLTDGGRSAAFTGNDCLDWAGHRTGPTYAVQGNILLGAEIIEGMEEAFLNSDGMLADRLLAALLAARVPGADTRCLQRGTSAISAFVHVVRDGDNLNEPYCDLNVNDTQTGVEPLDLLEAEYAEWVTEMSTSADEFLSSVTPARSTLTVGGGDTTLLVITLRNNQGEPLGEGVQLVVWTSLQSNVTNPEYAGEGVYTSILSSAQTAGPDTITVFSLAGIRQRELHDHPVVQVVNASAAEENRASVPGAYSLEIAPNPFNPATTVSLTLEKPSEALIRVYDLEGRLVRTIAEGFFAAGTTTIELRADNLPSGIYFVTARGDGFTQGKKVVLLK